MRALTTIVIAGAILLVVAIGLLVRGEGDDGDASREDARAAADARFERRGNGGTGRSARVEERLQRLREKNEGSAKERSGGRQDHLAAAPKRLEPNPDAKAMLPTPKSAGAGADDGEVEELDSDEAELVETLRSDPDPDERASAVFFLSGGDSRKVLPLLLEALEDPDSDVRLAAVEALEEYADEVDPNVLTPALNDPSPEVRFEALGIIGDMDNEEHVREIARRMLNDPDDEVRALAEGILDMEDS